VDAGAGDCPVGVDVGADLGVDAGLDADAGIGL
jgi:hypothetical protein